ncbi:MAG: amidohydrolase [Peptococcaceae bacterium]
METLYYNGTIITMESEDFFPEAVYVKDGIITAIGDFDTLAKNKSESCFIYDMQGATLMPSFIDGHGHFAMACQQYLTKVNLEDAHCFDDITYLLKKFIEDNHIPAGQTVLGSSYDHNFLQEKTHPDKRILDQASDQHPIVISHVSGHMGVANSLALKKANIDASTPDIAGGLIARYPNSSEPTGYLEETAIMLANSNNPPSFTTPLQDLLIVGQKIYIENGVTTVQDGAALEAILESIRNADATGNLKVDVVAYPLVQKPESIAAIMNQNADICGKYQQHVKIGGYKLVLDGSPQGKTAWLSKPYENSGTYCGYPWLDDTQVHTFIKKALEDNQQLLTHCNGDAASQQLLDIYEYELALSDNPNKNNLRPVMIHCQTVRDDQLERMAKMNMIPSIFVAHTWYWGDIHLQNLGSERGNHVSPVKSALNNGLCYNFHTDTPITQPDLLHSVWAAVNRVTRNDVKIGAEQCVSVYEALKGITINPAYAYFEENSKGSIKIGKRADLVILDRNPLTIDKMAIKDIQILETIKDGETIYKK